MVTVELPDHLYARMLEQSNRSGLSLEAWLEQVANPVMPADVPMQREMLYKSMLENYPFGLIALYSVDLVYIVCKGQGLQAIGMTSADFEGKRLRDIFPPEIYERDEPALLAALRGEITSVTLALGDDFFEVTTLPVRDETGAIQYGMVASRNVTELIRAQLAQKQLINKLEMAIGTANLGAWNLDLQTGRLDWNAQMFEIYGLAPENFTVTMDTFRSMLLEEDVAPTDAAFAQISVVGQVADVRFRIKRPDGELRYLVGSGCVVYDNAGQILQLTGLNMDVTDYERSQQKLKTSEAYYRALFEGSTNPIVVYDEQATIISLNKVAARDFGTTQEAATGRSLKEVVPVDYERVVRRIQHVLSTQEAFNGEDLVELPIGNKWYWSSFQPLMDDTNQVRAVQVLSYDITERKLNERLETEQTRLVLQLEQEKSLADLRAKLFSIISHELRTPLTIITSSSELLAQYYDRMTSDKRNEKLKHIQEQIRHLDRMLSEISMLSQTDTRFLNYRPASTNLKSFCDKFIQDCNPILQRGQTLILDYILNQHDAHIDANLLHHALINLVSNAIKYSPNGGEIRLAVSQQVNDIHFVVSDHGIGIPPNNVDQLFLPFVRADNVGNIRGTGLGLSIVKEIAELHAGTISVKSELGVGSAFNLTIPIKV